VYQHQCARTSQGSRVLQQQFARTTQARKGLDLYLKAKEKPELYASNIYKNEAEPQKSLKLDRVLIFTSNDLDKNATTTQKDCRGSEPTTH